jgi:hypothetical protein
MTTALAVIPLTYRTIDLARADLTIILEVVAGLNEVAQVRGTDTVIPSLAGRRARARVRDVRVIELRGWVMGAGSNDADQRSSFRDLVQELQALFDPTIVGDLVATLENGDTATIAARTTSLMWGDAPAPQLCALSVELESVEPEWVIT